MAIAVAGRISARRVIQVLSRLVAVHGPPKYLRSDNGPEFIKALRMWLEASGIQTAYTAPGKPWQNGTNESFKGRFRDGGFASRREAVVVIEAWRRDYNEERPYLSLDYKTPAEVGVRRAHDIYHCESRRWSSWITAAKSASPLCLRSSETAVRRLQRWAVTAREE